MDVELSVVVVKCVVGDWFVIKLWGVLFVAEKNERRRRNGGEREEGRSLCHKLNITDGFNMHSIKHDFFVLI
jgi:hypothetical protein